MISNLRISIIGRRLPGLIIFIAGTGVSLLGIATQAVADEPILVNIFNPERFDDRGLIGPALDVTPDGHIFLLGDDLWRYTPDGSRRSPVVNSNFNDEFLDVAVDGTGEISVSNPGPFNALHRIERRPSHNDIVLSPNAFEPRLGVDGSNNLYVGVVRFDGTNSEILRFNSSGDLSGAIDVPSPSEDETSLLTAIDVTKAGTIFIADYLSRPNTGETTMRAGRLDRTIPFFPIFVPLFAAPGVGGIIEVKGIAFDPVRDQVVITVSNVATKTSQIHRFDANDASLVNTTSIMGIAQNVDVDDYGSMYVVVHEPHYLIGIDPTITANDLDAAAREIVLPGKSFDESPEGAYFRGLAVRAARTRNNLYSVSEARWRLDELRRRANFDIDPQLTNPMSIAIEQINGFLTELEANSPLIVGEVEEVTETTEPHHDPLNPLWAIIEAFFGSDPFYGRYHAAQPISFPPPAHADLTLDPATATTNFVKPGIWGRGGERPEVISSTVSLDFNGLVPTVNEFTMVLGPFEINGQQSGLNRGRLSPSGQLHSQFGRQGRDFEAHVEGWITNDLYTESRPIVTFLDLQGFLPGNDDATVYGTNEPLIVPGLPGQPPTTTAGIGFVATRAEFNQTTGTLSFHENTDPSKTPDLSVILTPRGRIRARRRLRRTGSRCGRFDNAAPVHWPRRNERPLRIRRCFADDSWRRRSVRHSAAHRHRHRSGNISLYRQARVQLATAAYRQSVCKHVARWPGGYPAAHS
jgi:hypothetical protein